MIIRDHHLRSAFKINYGITGWYCWLTFPNWVEKSTNTLVSIENLAYISWFVLLQHKGENLNKYICLENQTSLTRISQNLGYWEWTKTVNNHSSHRLDTTCPLAFTVIKFLFWYPCLSLLSVPHLAHNSNDRGSRLNHKQ